MKKLVSFLFQLLFLTFNLWWTAGLLILSPPAFLSWCIIWVYDWSHGDLTKGYSPFKCWVMIFNDIWGIKR